MALLEAIAIAILDCGGKGFRGLRNPIRSFPSFRDSSPDRLRTLVGIPEFLRGIGGGVEAQVAKLESEIGDFNKLLVSCTLKLKKLSIPCKQLNQCREAPAPSVRFRHAISLKEYNGPIYTISEEHTKKLLVDAEEVDIEVRPQI